MLTELIQFTYKFKIILVQIQFSQLDFTESLTVNFSSNIHKYLQEIKFILNIQTDFTLHIIDYLL